MVVDNGGATPNKRHRSVVIETVSPIRSSGNNGGFCALWIGLLLALHTPVWIALVFYKEKVWQDETVGNEPTSTGVAVLRFLSRWLLEFTPWFANAMLSLFLGVLFLYMGFSTINISNPKKD